MGVSTPWPSTAPALIPALLGRTGAVQPPPSPPLKFWRNFVGNSIITIGANLVTANEEAENYLRIQQRFFIQLQKGYCILKKGMAHIEMAIAFFCTRVDRNDVDNWKKLKRVITWLQWTINDVRIIGCDNLDGLFTWVDASYAVWDNTRIQTGVCLSTRCGMINSKYRKQLLNKKSSTEAELVEVSDYLPYNIHLVSFMKEQKYEFKINKLYKYNQLAIKMEWNGKSSCTINSRHVNICYSFVKERLEKRKWR